MKSFGLLAIVSGLVTAAAPAPEVRDADMFTTGKSTATFARCFAQSQDRQSIAWAYVPRAHGGTFSNLGASSGKTPYFLLISDRGDRRQIELQNVAPGGAQTRGVLQCI